MKYNRAATMFLRYMQSQGNTTAHALTTASADDNLLRRYGSQFRSDTSKQLTQPELTRLRSLVQSMAGTSGGFTRHRAAKSFLRGAVPPMPADPNASAASAPTIPHGHVVINGADALLLSRVKRLSTANLTAIQNSVPLFTLFDINAGLKNGSRIFSVRSGVPAVS